MIVWSRNCVRNHYLVSCWCGDVDSFGQDTIRQTFGECGDIKSVRFAEDRETGEFRGFGHVEFYDGEHVDAAMKLANSDVMGRPIRVSVAVGSRRVCVWVASVLTFMV